MKELCDMTTEYDHRIKTLQEAMEESARPAFDDGDIENLRILIRLSVDFYYYLNSIPPWPRFADDPVHNTMYKIDSSFFNIDSFRRVMSAYGILVGATTTTVDWETVHVGSLKPQFLSVYEAFIAAGEFEAKCRLLLDLVKLQIVFAGAFCDCTA
jgi:hypothetical protein